MSDKPKKPGMYRVGSAFLWAAGMGTVAWYFPDEEKGFVTVVLSGLIAGWGTATLLGILGRGGAQKTFMVLAGFVFGVAMASGAVSITTGLAGLIFSGEPMTFDWDGYWSFVLSTAAIPASVLGPLTGFYVHGKFSKM